MFCDQKSKVDTPPHPPKKNNTKKQSNLIMKIIDKTRQSIPSNHFINTTCMKLQKTSTWQNLASRITPEWQLCWEFTSIYFSTKNPKSFSFAAFLHYRYRTLCWAAQKKKKSTSINNPHDVKECTLWKFTGDAKLVGSNRTTSAGWRNWMTGTSWSSAKPHAKSCIWNQSHVTAQAGY